MQSNKRVKPLIRRKPKSGNSMILLPNGERTRVDAELINDIITVNNHLKIHSSMKQLYEAALAAWLKANVMMHSELEAHVESNYTAISAHLHYDHTFDRFFSLVKEERLHRLTEAPIKGCIDFKPGYTTDDWFLDNPEPRSHPIFMNMIWAKDDDAGFEHHATLEWERYDQEVWDLLPRGPFNYGLPNPAGTSMPTPILIAALKKRGLPRDLKRINAYFEKYPEAKEALNDPS